MSTTGIDCVCALLVVHIGELGVELIDPAEHRSEQKLPWETRNGYPYNEGYLEMQEGKVSYTGSTDGPSLTVPRLTQQEFRILTKIHRPVVSFLDLSLDLYIDGRSFLAHTVKCGAGWSNNHTRSEMYYTENNEVRVAALKFAALVGQLILLLIMCLALIVLEQNKRG